MRFSAPTISSLGQFGIMHSYDVTLKDLYSLLRLGIKPGLKCIKGLLSVLGDPHGGYPAIHIAGTNGKGSTSAMLEAVLTEAGYRTGLFTSPHLVKLNERIRISKRQIPDGDVVKIAATVKKAAESLAPVLKPTFFEFISAMAFVYFEKNKVDIAIFETGMGGRLDATNVCNPLVSIITNIGKDHTSHLGTSISRIAKEKAGIIRPLVPVVTGADNPAALKIIRAEAAMKETSRYCIGEDFWTDAVTTPRSNAFNYYGIAKVIKGLKLNLRGQFQLKNAACALASLEVLSTLGYPVPTESVRKGLKKILWPGRLEVVGRRGRRYKAKGTGACTSRTWPLVILDVAHNPDAALSLKEALARQSFSRLVLVAGIMGDKDIRGVFAHLAPLADIVVLTEPTNPRAANAERLLKFLKPWKRPFLIRRSVAEACEAALELSGPKDAVCVTGSVFTVGEAIQYLEKICP